MAYFIFNSFYNLYLHPLRNFPGPKAWAASRIPHSYGIIRGEIHKDILRLHETYGDVVRVSPNELAFQNVEAWEEIYGHRKGAQKGDENAKDPQFYGFHRGNIIGSNREDHSRWRRILSHGFSQKALVEQQPLIMGYVDLLISRLRTHSAGGSKPVEMTSWYNWTAFDIIGDLAFGEPFFCLEKSVQHPWITFIFESVKGNVLNAEISRIPIVSTILKWLMTGKAMEKQQEMFQLTSTNIKKRMELTVSRPDIIEAMISKNGTDLQMTWEEILNNVNILIVAGSETTATALSGTTYYLATNPEPLAKLVAEVRAAFQSEDEINIHSVQQLTYLSAVISESLRVFPPATIALPRVAAAGSQVNGRHIPQGTVMGLWLWPATHSERNFVEPKKFIPERWLGQDPKYANDKRQLSQPFSVGPRNCIGMK